MLLNDRDCGRKMESQPIGEKELENSNVDTEVLIKSNSLIIMIVCVFTGLVMKQTYIVGNIFDLPVITGSFSGSIRIHFQWTVIQLYTEVAEQSGHNRKLNWISFYSVGGKNIQKLYSTKFLAISGNFEQR